MESVDIYKYPGEDVLRNKFDCHNNEELALIEALSTGGNLAYLQLHPINGKFDFKHLKDIHFFIFQDIYDWAGMIRTIDISKNNLFCRAQFIENYASSVFSDFYASCKAAKKDKQEFVKILASHYADMNALHPFREGNGRSQREFARELCIECGYVFDLTVTSHSEMLEASVLSFNKADNSGLEAIFDKCLTPIDEYKDLQKNFTSKLMILSSDDIDDGMSNRLFGK